MLKFDALGNVTLLHVADMHGQLMPVYFREPSVNLGVGEARGQPPHLTGKDFLKRFGIPEKSAAAYALTDQDFAALAQILRPHRRARPAGHGGQGACAPSAATTRCCCSTAATPGRARSARTAAKARTWSTAWRCSKPDAMTGHWEFTYGEARVKELIEGLGFPFLALNIRDTEWNEPAFQPMKMFEKGGVKIAVLGQAFPYTPVANPRWMMPKWSFGIREEDVRANVDKARKEGAQLVVLLSHNGFDVDRKLASRVAGIDVILTSHTHDALPEAIKVGKTLLVASGSHGKFVSRLDLDVQGGGVKGFPLQADPAVCRCDQAGCGDGGGDRQGARALRQELARVVGRTEFAALPARQFQRHVRRSDLRGAFEGARRRDRAVAGLPLGHQRAAGPADHGRGHPQRDRDHLSAGLPHHR